jgi:hypothetical protein
MIRAALRWLTLNFVWTVAPLVALSVQVTEAELSGAGAPQVTVKVYNSAHVSARDLAKAKAQATGIFWKVGIKLTWVPDFMVPEVKAGSASQTWNSAYLQLRIWRHFHIKSKVIGSDTLGFCISMEEGDAVVLSDEVQNFAQWIRFGDTANLLGLAMAHEIGHVLLRTLGHSGEGIIQAPWRPKDLRDSEHGLLLFTPEQGQLMRNEVARRMLGRLGAQAPNRAENRSHKP